MNVSFTKNDSAQWSDLVRIFKEYTEIIIIIIVHLGVDRG
jgi:hypothetical protein